MFAIPTMIVKNSGDRFFHNGILLSLPPELRDKVRLDKYQTLGSPGWHTSEFGYHAYVFLHTSGDRFIFPGLIVTGESKPNKYFSGYKNEVTRNEVENLANGLTQLTDEATHIAYQDLNFLIHDLRGLSGLIYNSAVEAQYFLRGHSLNDVDVRIQNILASQGMLKIRIDALDFISNPASIITTRKIAAYRKIDKVVRSFMPKAYSQSKPLRLSGSSYSEIDGPDIFEIIPYTFIDNAIKYGPRGQQIFIDVIEASSIVFQVTSFGPRITKEELETIFTKGGRGRAAKESSIPGSGVGLHTVKRLIEQHFGGKIWVSQSENPLTFDEMEFFETKFFSEFPLTK